MKRGFAVKIILGLMLVAALAAIGYWLLDTLSGFIINALSGATVEQDAYYGEMATPEPLPTMPDYIGDDSFYDNAGSVDFGDE